MATLEIEKRANGHVPAAAYSDGSERGLSALERYSLMKKIMDLALADAKTPVEISEVRLQAQAAELYAKAHLSLKHVLEAQEVHVWAARRAGEFRMKLPRLGGGLRMRYSEIKKMRARGASFTECARRYGCSEDDVRKAEDEGFYQVPTLKQFDDQFGVDRYMGHRWETVAEIPEERFCSYVAELKRSERGDPRVTVGGILRLFNRDGEIKVATGVFLQPDGCYVIRWRERKAPKWETLRPGTTKDEAITERSKRLGKIKTKATVAGGDLSHVYSAIDVARRLLGDVWGELTPGQKQLLDGMYSRWDDDAKAIHAATNVR